MKRLSAWILSSKRTRAAVVLLVTGCASLPDTAPSFRVAQDFSMTARIAVRYAAEANDPSTEQGFSGRFRWKQQGQLSVIDLHSPLGDTVARLTGNPDAVRMELASGRVVAATSWSALTQQELGWRLPVEGMVWWLQGKPQPGIDVQPFTDVHNRLQRLVQSGWEIDYLAWQNGLPSRIRLQHERIDIRLVIESWS